jgi:ketosteroid isomerase-like protein
MSEANVEVVREVYTQFRATGRFDDDIAVSDFVVDASTFDGWPVEPYEGLEGARQFLAEWTAGFDTCEFEVEALHDAGDWIVAVVRQRVLLKETGLRLDETFAQVWTLRDGKLARLDVWRDTTKALKAVGLAE